MAPVYLDNENQAIKIELIWPLILASVGLTMMQTNDVVMMREVIALGAMAFVFNLPVLIIALLKTLAKEEQM